ncbi:hypothetical protein K502DRAFT_333920 [Neoconidiobolus thromboides FSU 785]|nr:hypothetical protein K502DRAFT_333920 [Neoconidiobolus thromboides FSU 785]
MSSENEFNNRIEEIDFGKFINGNDNTKDANFIQASSSNGPRNVSANINFSLVNSNNNATDDITFDQLASDNISQNKECIDYDGLTNKSNNSDTEGINSKQSYSNHDSSTNEDKVLEGIDQESNEGFLKTIKKQKKALKKSIKEDMDKIEQLKVGIQEKQEQIGSLNEVKEELEKKDILKKKRLLLDLSGQPVPKKLTAERKTLVMEEYEKKTLSVKELCVKYKISRTTFYTLKKKCDDIKKGIIKEKVCIKGRTSKINKDQMGILYYEIISQPKATFTTRELTNMMNESFNFNISESTIRRALQRAKNGWKTEAKIPDGWNEPNILELRKKFVQHLPDYGREENIGYSWALKGRKKILANRKRQKPLHLILAINKIYERFRRNSR